jgi:hypothetical protein
VDVGDGRATTAVKEVGGLETLARASLQANP